MVGDFLLNKLTDMRCCVWHNASSTQFNYVLVVGMPWMPFLAVWRRTTPHYASRSICGRFHAETRIVAASWCRILCGRSSSKTALWSQEGVNNALFDKNMLAFEDWKAWRGHPMSLFQYVRVLLASCKRKHVAQTRRFRVKRSVSWWGIVFGSVAAQRPWIKISHTEIVFPRIDSLCMLVLRHWTNNRIQTLPPTQNSRVQYIYSRWVFRLNERTTCSKTMLTVQELSSHQIRHEASSSSISTAT